MALFGSAQRTAVDANGQKKYQGPAPLAPVPLLPVDTTAAAGAAVTAAADAAKRLKKKAAAGGGDTLLTAPAAGVQATARPTSLLGS